jgi:hypothetical protein
MRSMGERRQSLDLGVLALIKGASKSREAWEAEYPHLSPLDDGHMLLLNWAATVDRQGVVLARLAMSPETRVELESEMPGMVDRAPAWMDAHLEGRPTMTLRLFLEGIAQTLTTHRAAIEQVVAEQVADPEEIEETLAEAPVPAGTPDEERSALLHGVSHAMLAHTKAIVDVAYDFEIQARRALGGED